MFIGKQSSIHRYIIPQSSLGLHNIIIQRTSITFLPHHQLDLQLFSPGLPASHLVHKIGSMNYYSRLATRFHFVPRDVLENDFTFPTEQLAHGIRCQLLRLLNAIPAQGGKKSKSIRLYRHNHVSIRPFKELTLTHVKPGLQNAHKECTHLAKLLILRPRSNRVEEGLDSNIDESGIFEVLLQLFGFGGLQLRLVNVSCKSWNGVDKP